jgi:hypothetical protein
VRKKVYIIYTGGTIGKSKTKDGYSPLKGNMEKELEMIRELKNEEMPTYKFHEYEPLLDSANMNLKDWIKIAKDIKENYEEYSGFVILHGTDTMAYTASALSFMLENLGKPVIITGSQIPLFEIRNDARDNLIASMILATNSKLQEVCLYFGNTLMRGNRTTKVSSSSLNAFESPNYPPLGTAGVSIVLDTNAIIRNIYDAIPDSYKQKFPYITGMDEAGNPMHYYASIIHYLNNKSIQLLFIKNATEKWKDMIIKDVEKENHLPHFIILEIYDGNNKTAGSSGTVTNKPRSFFIKGVKYSLDSCIIRDTSQQHFCATLTCEKKEMAYDGMSYHRLVDLSWTKYINSDFSWGFEGSNHSDGTPLKWNFTHGYQMLLYYRYTF